jgi:Fur family transcriptional regulator, peroxide stress response regulator
MKEHGPKKMKMTPQRAAILEYLDGNTSHPSADDIFVALRLKYPMVSFATVYNTLEYMKKNGMIWELSIDEERRRYDPNTKLHHHLICTKCRKVVDIHKDFDLEVPKEMTQGFTITGKHVEFYGVCWECLEGL